MSARRRIISSALQEYVSFVPWRVVLHVRVANLTHVLDVLIVRHFWLMGLVFVLLAPFGFLTHGNVDQRRKLSKLLMLFVLSFDPSRRAHQTANIVRSRGARSAQMGFT